MKRVKFLKLTQQNLENYMLSSNTIEKITTHPAHKGLGKKDLAKIDDLVNQQLVTKSLGGQVQFGFKSFAAVKPALRSALLTYEVIAVSNLSTLNDTSSENEETREQVIAASYKAFEILRLYPIPKSRDEQIQFVFRIASLAYCGKRWSDLKTWFSNNPSVIDENPIKKKSWDQYLLSHLYFCWIRLFQKESRTDLDKILATISKLHEEQDKREKQFFDELEQNQHQNGAIRLATLYYWVRCTEIVTKFILKGVTEGNPLGQIDMYFERAIDCAKICGEWQIEYMLAWLHSTSKAMITNSMWWIFRNADSKTTEFVRTLTHRNQNPIFELLLPQQLAIHEGLFDTSKFVIVVDMPASQGTLLLAQLKILQTLSLTERENGWVAYLTLSPALTSQITRQLRHDFSGLDIVIEQLTSSIDTNALEEELLEDTEGLFDILVTTPEKFYQVVRNKKFDKRPPKLVVLDETHYIADEEHGLGIELLLATLKQEFPNLNFLLFMNDVKGAQSMVNWLAGDESSSLSISSGTTPWKPNERIVGLFRAVEDYKSKTSWYLEFEPLKTTEKAIALLGRHQVGANKPIKIPKSKVVSYIGQTGLAYQAVTMSKVMSENGTSIAIGETIPTVWIMAKVASNSMPKQNDIPPEIKLVQDYLHNEVGSEFNLINFLSKRVAVHHSGLSDEVQTLVGWLAESGLLDVLCTTPTMTQRLNYPISSIFLQSLKYSNGKEMSSREFWNLAECAGRIGQDDIGILGLAAGHDPDSLKSLVQSKSAEPISQLVRLLNELEEKGDLDTLSDNLLKPQWESFRNYLVQLWMKKKDLNAVLSVTELVLRQTFGYTSLNQNSKHQAKANALRKATQDYIVRLSEMSLRTLELAIQTGFSPEDIDCALHAFNNLNNPISIEDWNPNTLFKDGGKMADLYSVMLKIPKLRENLTEIGGKGAKHIKLANFTKDWVNGETIKDIATRYFSVGKENANPTTAISKTFQVINNAIITDGTWGVSAISRFSDINFDDRSEMERKKLNLIPAMICHGVDSEEAILLRMNCIPRNIAKEMGRRFGHWINERGDRMNVSAASQFLKSLNSDDWQSIFPKSMSISGKDYKRVWEILSGESSSN